MQPVRAAARLTAHSGHFVGEPGEVGGKNGRRNQRLIRHGLERRSGGRCVAICGVYPGIGFSHVLGRCRFTGVRVMVVRTPLNS
jgi:hypothetical protein